MKIIYEYRIVYLCPNDCGGAEFDEYDYVPLCGNCKKELNLNSWRFCPYCGERIELVDKPTIIEAEE